MVGALPFGFLRLVGIVRTKFLPASLHGAEGSHISCKNLNSFRTGIVSACWPKKLPMANPQAVLSLLDAPDCCDPELYVIWGRFRQMMRFLAYRPDEVPIHMDIENKNVCNNVGKVLDGWADTPFCLCTDGDLLCCICNMVLYRSARSVRVS